MTVRYESPVAVLDLISLTRQWDTALVVPHLGYAIEYWAIVKTAFNELIGKKELVFTKTSIIDRRQHTALRLWVPYAPDPTMPMDFPHRFKYKCDYCSPYYTKGELRAIAGNL